MKQYHDVHDSKCPTCGGETVMTALLFFDGSMIRLDSTCTKCGHELMTLYTIDSVVDEFADSE